MWPKKTLNGIEIDGVPNMVLKSELKYSPVKKVGRM